MMKLRTDRYVSLVSASDPERNVSRTSQMAFSVEYLLPRDSYEISVEEDHIGIAVSRDLPLRVERLRNLQDPDGRIQAGIAERSGRVHVGDLVTGVNGQNVGDVPAQDVITLLTLKRPVTITFSLPRDEKHTNSLSPVS